MKKYIAAFLLFCSMQTESREVTSGLFTSPFDFPLYLSANFGELRSNHFHGGLDFKTQNVEGKPIRCIAEGYISRATVSAGGFGKAVYVVHQNGYTSLYGHIQTFTPEIAALVEKYQYEHETFDTDIRFDSLRFPVKQGDFIALSGNEGFSFGPHLHMEIIKTTTGERIDPMPFYKEKIKDNIPPRANSITIYPQQGKGTVNGTCAKQTFAVAATKTNCILKPIQAWGNIGLGIKAFDYMNGTTNHYGIHSVTLYVDNKEVFNSTLDSFLPDESRMINSWTDFDEFKRYNSWVMKSFIAPGNTFRGLKSGAENGIITIDRERDYAVKYVLTDFYGNSSTYCFTIKGKKQDIPTHRPDMRNYLCWNKTNVIQQPGIELIIPRGMLYEDVVLNSYTRSDSNAIAFEYQLHDVYYPLHAGCDLTIGIRNMPVKDSTKYYVARKMGKTLHDVGGRYENGWMKTSIRELGTYTVAIDTVPPKVVPINKSSWNRTGTISYKISDAQTGIKTYKGKIDGKFALFGYSAKTGRLTCRIDPKRIRKSGRHTLELTVTDRCGNQQIIKELFIW